MATGTVDIQTGCSAVALGAGATVDEAIDRRENEFIDDQRADPAATNVLAFRFRTR